MSLQELIERKERINNWFISYQMDCSFFIAFFFFFGLFFCNFAFLLLFVVVVVVVVVVAVVIVVADWVFGCFLSCSSGE
jgi:predicted Co/Zn/Cd cation transporter (cation efflux family)